MLIALWLASPANGTMTGPHTTNESLVGREYQNLPLLVLTF